MRAEQFDRLTAVLCAAGKAITWRAGALALIFRTTGSCGTHGHAVERSHGVLAHLHNLASGFGFCFFVFKTWQQTQTQAAKTSHFLAEVEAARRGNGRPSRETTGEASAGMTFFIPRGFCWRKLVRFLSKLHFRFTVPLTSNK